MPLSSSQIISAGLGGLGILNQSDANRRMETSANEQIAWQRELILRQIEQEQELHDIAVAADKAGQFDPEKRRELAKEFVNRNSDIAMRSQAAAASALGYRPGDSKPLDSMNQIRGDENLRLQDLYDQIGDRALNAKLAAYAAANPASLNAAMAALGDNARFDISREQPSGLLGSLAPYLTPARQSTGSGGLGGYSGSDGSVTGDVVTPLGTTSQSTSAFGYSASPAPSNAYDTPPMRRKSPLDSWFRANGSQPTGF